MSAGEHFSGQQNVNIPMNPEAGIINLLRQGFFALQLLPENTSAGMLLLLQNLTINDLLYSTWVINPSFYFLSK